jgi:hypothetical protein
MFFVAWNSSARPACSDERLVVNRLLNILLCVYMVVRPADGEAGTDV